MTTIELVRLTKGEVSSLSGHNRGLAARELFKLDDVDKAFEVINVSAPDNLVAITPSFIQGMFARSVHTLGRERFFTHYKFDFPNHLMTDVHLGIERAMMRRELSGAA